MCVPDDGLDARAGCASPSVHVQRCTSDIPDHHVCVLELKEAAESTKAQHRSEKQRRKQVELRLNSLEEELQDLKTEKEGLERVRRL